MNPRAVIAEDEPLLRSQLKAKLKKLWPALEIVAEAGDGRTALQAIIDLSPDLAFLDIKMPEMTGIDVAHELASAKDQPCHLVFVTAFDQYALDAFETGVIDYVLKPYSDDRLKTTVERLRQRLSSGEPHPIQDLQALVEKFKKNFSPDTERLKWIKASIGSNLHLIPVEDVLFFQSDEKYTLVATKDLDALIKTPIKDLISALDPDKYWQIHRSTVVNVTAIEAVQRDEQGQASVRVRGRKEKLVVSRTFSHLFKQM